MTTSGPRGHAPDNVRFRNCHPAVGDSRAELLHGLRQRQKRIDPKYFYDERGSALFDRITQLPEYYPTRTEKDILSAHRGAIADACGKRCVLIEPGSGTCEKVRLLLDALRPAIYVPIDISADFLQQSARALGREFPWLEVHAICADFRQDWQVADLLPAGKRVVFYPGSTIGNLEPEQAAGFLRQLRDWLGADGGAVIGVDLHKSSVRLTAAYNDDQGVTAEFNRNILRRINPLLDADFDPAAFEHRAFYNTGEQRVEMHLVSKRAQTVHCVGHPLHFAQGETIHTENSYKYTPAGFDRLARSAGMRVQQCWLDEKALFSVNYLTRA
jgi:dimethylhistidine N-methyltransferase